MRKLVVVVIVAFATAAIGQDAPTWSRRYANAQRIGGIEPFGDGYALALDRGAADCLAEIAANGNGLRQNCVDGAPTNLATAKDALFLYGNRLTGAEPHPWAGKFDGQLQVVWSRRIDAPEKLVIYDGAATTDGGLVLIGGYGENCKPGCPMQRASGVVKLAADGSLQWFRVLDETGYEIATSIRAYADGYVTAVAGQNNRLRVTRVDRDGAPVWSCWLRDVMGKPHLAVLSGGDIIVASDGATGYVVARISSAGRVVWQKQSIASTADAQAVIARRDGTFVLYGRAMVRDKWSGHLIAFDGNGGVLWQRAILFGPEMVTESVNAAGDGSLLVAIGNESHAELHKFSPAGDVPAALIPITIVSDVAFTPLRSVPVTATVDSSRIEMQTADDPLSAHAQTIVTENVQPAHAAAPVVTATPMKPEQQAALATAQRGIDEEDALRKHVVELLSARNFAELDRLGREFRETNATFPSALSKLAALYQAASTPALEYGDAQQHLKLVEDWMKASPASATAAAAAADTYIEYAWEARGKSTAEAVTSEAWKNFERLLGRASEILSASKSFAQDDPGYQSDRVDIAGAGCDRLEDVVHDPHFSRLSDWSMWRSAANFMLPRWCGTPGAYRRFAEYAAASTRADYGDGLYALLAFDAVRREHDRSTIAEYKFEWPRIRQGFRDIIKRFPDAPYGYHRLAFLAWFFDDRAAAKQMFDTPWLVWSSFARDIWPDYGQFEQARRWAAEQPARSFVTSNEAKSSPANASALRKVPESSTSWIAAGAANWPPILLVSDVTLQDGTSQHPAAFLLQTKNGVVAVSALTAFGTVQHREAHDGFPALTLVVPMPLAVFRAKLASWTVATPAKTPRKFTVASIDPKANVGSNAVVLTLAPGSGKLPAKVLEPRTGPPSYSGRVYIVGCRPQSEPCAQSAFPATVSGGGSGAGEVRLSLVLDDAVSWSDLVGGPVIDENGHVIGVVDGPSGNFSLQDKPGTVRVDIDEINSLLARAGV